MTNPIGILVKIISRGTRYDQSIRLDYTYPFNNNNGKIELGYKREYDKMSSQYYAEQLFDETWRSIHLQISMITTKM